MKKFLFGIFALTFLIYFFSSPGPTSYDYFTRLADSFLEGKYYLTQNPPWLSELLPGGAGKYYVVYPPMPAILSMPFRLLLKENFEQSYLSFLLGAGIVVLTILISLKIKQDKGLAIFSGTLIGFGSIVWYLSSVGSSWYLGQITSAFFLLAALLEGLGKKRSFLMGIFIGAAYLSRVHTIVSLPVFIYLLKRRNFKLELVKLFSGILPFLLFDSWYNFVRFGSFFNKGYFLLPSYLNETDKPWFIYGVANIRYIPNGLKAALWSFPKTIKTFPYLIPSLYSTAIWITSPAFVFALIAPFKNNLVKLLWFSVTTIFLVVLMHGGVGWAQFGYRFAVDFYPFLITLVILALSKRNLTWFNWSLLTISILVNLWGVILINKYGLGSY